MLGSVQDGSPTQPGPTGLPPPAPGETLDAPAAGAAAIRGSVLRSGGYALGVALSLISAPLLIRHLGLDEFGVYATIVALVTIVSGLSELGLTSLGVREWVQRDALSRARLMHDLLGARLAFAGIGCAGAMVFAVAAGYDGHRLLGTALACVGVVIQGVQAALTVPLAGRLRQGVIASAELLRQAVLVALIVVLVIAGAGLVPLLAASIPAAIASLVFTAIRAPEGLVMPSFHPRHWAHLLRGTVPFAAAVAVNIIYFRITMIVTSLVASATQSGEFAVAFRVLEVLITVPGLLIGALFPLFAHAAVADRERLRSSLQRTWETALVVGALVAVVVAAGAPLAVLVLSGHTPSGAVGALRILGVGLGFAFLGATAQFGLLSVRAHRPILIVNLTVLPLNALLTVLLAPDHGAIGSAIALATSEVVLALASTIVLHHATGAPRPDLRLLARLAGVVLVGAAATVLLSPVGVVLPALLVPAVTLAAAALAGVLPREAMAALIARRAPAS
jgi:O-antigen/teichoic acid export membrane protein